MEDFSESFKTLYVFLENTMSDYCFKTSFFYMFDFAVVIGQNFPSVHLPFHNTDIIYFYPPMSNDGGVFVQYVYRLSVVIFAITFELKEKETSYLLCILH